MMPQAKQRENLKVVRKRMDKMTEKRSKTYSFAVAFGLHALLVCLLFVGIEKTIVIHEDSPQPPTEIIEAVMVNKQALKAEVDRLEAIEAKKREQEVTRQRELVRQENEAKQKRQKEEALALELKQKNEVLKKEAEQLKIKQQKEALEQQKKLKAEAEELKKIKKEKEAAIAAKKAEEDKKNQDLAKQQALEKQKQLDEAKAAAQQASARADQDLITKHARLIKNKITQSWRQPLGIDINSLKCKVAVKLLPTGEVVEAVVLESSGNVEFDRSTELAIQKASPLPMPEDPQVATEFRHFNFTFNPGAA